MRSGVMAIWRMNEIIAREVSDCNENHQSTSSRVSGSPSLPVLSMVWILRISILPVVRILWLSVVGALLDRNTERTFHLPFFIFR